MSGRIKANKYVYFTVYEMVLHDVGEKIEPDKDDLASQGGVGLHLLHITLFQTRNDMQD